MNIEKIDISLIKENPDNPRYIKDDKFVKLKQSIIDFPEMLQLRPIVIDNNNMVLGGNMRLRAIKELGYNYGFVVRADSLSEKQKKEFIIKDNIPFGENDWDKLAEWDQDELKSWGMDLPESWDKKEAVEDDYEIPDEIKTDIIIGDLFEIGPHRLLCGDSTKKEDIERMMNGEKSNLCMTSPPYWVGKDYEKEKSEKEIDDFIKNITESIVFCMKFDYSRIVINSGTGMATSLGEKKTRIILLIDKWINNFYINNWNLRTLRHWIKGGGSPVKKSPIADICYSGIEYLLTFYNNQSKSRGQNRLADNWCQQSDWTDIKGDKQHNKAGYSIEIPIGRKCNGMEIEPCYCQVIVDRMLKLDPTIQIKKNDEIYSKTLT
jgi:DNA modification methylase